MRTSCTRYDPNTGKCKLTNQPAQCGFDCFGHTYIPDNYDPHWQFFDRNHPGFKAKDEDVSEPWESMKHFQD